MLKDILEGKNVSIYCIINKEDKRIYITYAIETFLSINYSINKLKNILYEDRNKVNIEIIETHHKKPSNLYLKWRVNELYEEYKNLGYTFYTAYKPLQWNLYMRVGQPSGSRGSSNYKAIVKLKTSANIVYEVKAFDTIEEAQLFVQGNTISTVVRLL